MSPILQSSMTSFDRMNASPRGATRMDRNLHGRGIQVSNDGILYVRWVYDNRGNAWADCHGNRAFYVVPRCDFTLMDSAMRKGMPVILIVRRDHEDYNYGEYLVTSILPYSSTTYRAELSRCEAVAPNNSQPDHGAGVGREGHKRHCIDADVEEKDASHSDDDSMCQTDTDDENVNQVDGDRYLVERILGHRFDLSFGWEFHVAWKGYSERTWEPLKHMVHNHRINTHFKQYCIEHELSRPMSLAVAMCE